MLLWIFFVNICFHFLLGIFLGMRMLDSMVTLCLIFWETVRLYSDNISCIIYSLAMYECSNFFTFLPTVITVSPFGCSNSCVCEVLSHWVLMCILITSNDIFMCLLAICMFSLKSRSYIFFFSFYWVFIVFL